MTWALRQDQLRLGNLDLPSVVETKRQLSSLIASTYDPLGIVLPFVVCFKLILQELWLQDLAWDDRLPVELLRKVSKRMVDLPLLSGVKVLIGTVLVTGNTAVHGLYGVGNCW